jgi:hypothetical protein
VKVKTSPTVKERIESTKVKTCRQIAMTQRRHCTLVGGNGGGKRWENFSLSMPDFNLLKL